MVWPTLDAVKNNYILKTSLLPSLLRLLKKLRKPLNLNHLL